MDRVTFIGSVDRRLDRPERRRRGKPVVSVVPRRGVHVEVGRGEANRHRDILGPVGKRERVAARRGEHAVGEPPVDRSDNAWQRHCRKCHRGGRVRHEDGRRNRAAEAIDCGSEADQARHAALVASAVDHRTLHAGVAGEVCRTRLGRVGGVACVNGGRT